MKQREICGPKTKKQEYIGDGHFLPSQIADWCLNIQIQIFKHQYRKWSLIVGFGVRSIAGHITMYGQKQPAGRSKSRRGPNPAHRPYVARPWSSGMYRGVHPPLSLWSIPPSSRKISPLTQRRRKWMIEKHNFTAEFHCRILTLSD